MADRADERVLVFAPGRDGPLTRAVLAEAGVDALAFAEPEAFCHALADGVGAVILAEELLTQPVVKRLAECLADQPPWSDLPVLVVANADRPVAGLLKALSVLGNVSVLSRPLPLDTLASAVRAALRARGRQYQVRDLLAEREQQARRKDEYLAMLAHELRNPLAPVANAAHFLRLCTENDTGLAWAHDTIERQVRQMSRLIDSLLDAARLTRGQVELHRRPVRLDEVVTRAADTARALIEGRRHSLQRDLPAGPLWLSADPDRLEQVFVNLLDNAAKYTEPGGRIRLSAAAEGAWIVVRVRDTGVGIAPDLLPRIFDPFEQGARPLDRSQGGLGIGLTVVKRLVEQHGGTIVAHSEGPGKGSEFTVRLPALPTVAAAPAGGGGAGAARNGGSLDVLLVEDNEDGAKSLAMLLRLWGHRVRMARDGKTGLAAAAERRPDVVLLDVGLPGLTGYEVAERLRAEPAQAGLPIIAITGYGSAEDKARTRAAGFDHHLVKPVDPEELHHLLNELQPSGAAG